EALALDRYLRGVGLGTHHDAPPEELVPTPDLHLSLWDQQVLGLGVQHRHGEGARSEAVELPDHVADRRVLEVGVAVATQVHDSDAVLSLLLGRVPTLGEWWRPDQASTSDQGRVAAHLDGLWRRLQQQWIAGL